MLKKIVIVVVAVLFLILPSSQVFAGGSEGRFSWSFQEPFPVYGFKDFKPEVFELLGMAIEVDGVVYLNAGNFSSKNQRASKAILKVSEEIPLIVGKPAFFRVKPTREKEEELFGAYILLEDNEKFSDLYDKWHELTGPDLS